MIRAPLFTMDAATSYASGGGVSVTAARADAAALQAKALTGDRVALAQLQHKAATEPNMLARQLYNSALRRFNQYATTQATASTTTPLRSGAPVGWTWLGPLPSAAEPNPLGTWMREESSGTQTRYTNVRYASAPWTLAPADVQPLSLPTAAPLLAPVRADVQFSATDLQAPRSRDLTGGVMSAEAMAMIPVRSVWDRYRWAIIGGAALLVGCALYAARARA